MKRIGMIIVLTLFFSFILTWFAFADSNEAVPYADSEFSSVTTSLKSTKQVSFRAVTYNLKSSISVTACWLEKKNNNGLWTTICSLEVPSDVSEDDFSYYATMDYSSKIGTGTYRIRATYDADGHAITRYSNERKF